MTAPYCFDVGALTDVGRRRKDNQDSVLCAQAWDGDAYARLHETYGHLYLVADGVGGNDQGEVASRMVVDHVMGYFYSDDAYPSNPVDRLGTAIQRATRDIYEEAHRMRNNMASTLVAALVHDHTVTIANVGDSPAFLCRSGEAPQKLTVDHIRRERDGSQYLAQSMGDASVNVAFRTLDFVAGDIIVLCSDGLSDLVKPEQIKRVVSANPARRAVRELVDLANRYGGHDNISVLVVRHGKLPLLHRKQIRQLIGAGMVIALLLLMLMFGMRGLLAETMAMADQSDQGVSFAGRSISVPVLNATTGLMEMVQATITPTLPPTQLPIVDAPKESMIVAPVGKAPLPTQVVYTVSTPTALRGVSPSEAAGAPQAVMQPVHTSPSGAPRLPTVTHATPRPTETRPTNPPSVIATPYPTDLLPTSTLPASTTRPTAVPTATTRPTDEPDDRGSQPASAPRPTDAPTATPQSTRPPAATLQPTSTPTAVPGKAQPKPETTPDTKPIPKVEPTAAPKVEPTAAPKVEPTAAPKVEPTEVMLPEPTATPIEPTAVPQPEPTKVPKVEPTEASLPDPTKAPKAEPTEVPPPDPTTAPPKEATATTND